MKMLVIMWCMRHVTHAAQVRCVRLIHCFMLVNDLPMQCLQPVAGIDAVLYRI